MARSQARHQPTPTLISPALPFDPVDTFVATKHRNFSDAPVVTLIPVTVATVRDAIINPAVRPFLDAGGAVVFAFETQAAANEFRRIHRDIRAAHGVPPATHHAPSQTQ